MSVLPPETFRVRPSPDTQCHFVVNISETREEMLARMTELGYDPHPDLVASCFWARCDDIPELLGILWFSQRDIGGGVVAHEMGHAAFRALEAIGVTVDHVNDRVRLSEEDYRAGSTEERFCEALEHLVKEFWCEYYDRNLGAPGDRADA